MSDFTVTFSIPRRRIRDVIMALTTTYSPWLHEIAWKNLRHVELIVKFDREQDDEGDGKGRKVIKGAAIEKGLKAMAKHCPRRLAFILNEDYDALDADAFMQCVVFGKLVYG
jgi:hypothetical protein